MWYDHRFRRILNSSCVPVTKVVTNRTRSGRTCLNRRSTPRSCRLHRGCNEQTESLQFGNIDEQFPRNSFVLCQDFMFQERLTVTSKQIFSSTSRNWRRITFSAYFIYFWGFAGIKNNIYILFFQFQMLNIQILTLNKVIFLGYRSNHNNTPMFPPTHPWFECSCN